MSNTRKMVLGLMSGTSLDGLDLAACVFFQVEGDWKFELICAETVDYAASWKKNLSSLMSGTALEFVKADADLGYYFGDEVVKFVNKYQIKPELIASHGHTIFHQPENGFTTQIGNGSCIASKTGIPVVFDFRSLDVALGGQGAPLVPIGDKLLFSEYDFCLNLGGIANISYDTDTGVRVAYDICPVNMVMNRIAMEKGYEYDDGGLLAAAGELNIGLLEKLESLDFYFSKGPKSIGQEWVETEVMPMINSSALSAEDKLHTFAVHVAKRIMEEMAQISKSNIKMLITGGGAFNSFLIKMFERENKNKVDLIIPDKMIVAYKEAIIFAFLGYLRLLGKKNCLASVTGARQDVSGGTIVTP